MGPCGPNQCLRGSNQGPAEQIRALAGQIRAPRSKPKFRIRSKLGLHGPNQGPQVEVGPLHRPNQAPCGPNQGPRRPNQDPHGLSKGTCRSSCCDQSVLNYVLGASDPPPPHPTQCVLSENAYLSKWCKKKTPSGYNYQTTV